MNALSASSRLLTSPLRVLLGISPFVVLTALGLFGLYRFDGTAGTQANAPLFWPSSSAIERQPGEPALLIFAHPLCPCTRATFSEISQLLHPRVNGQRPLVHVLFVRPAWNRVWENSDTWQEAKSMVSTLTAWDEDGQEARLFNVRTSGLVLLYGANNRLLFQGGVTGSRGHVGDNYGLERLRNALETGKPASLWTHVFGCSLAVNGRWS
jgi:hypothetical protein